MIVTFQEIIDIAIMTVAVGFIFSDVFARFVRPRDPIAALQRTRIADEGFKFAVIVTAPAIILHELAHKFVAMAFGLSSVFRAAYSWLAIGVMLKLIGAPFIFFVPAYVQIIGHAGPLESAMIAFAGPAVNLMLWLGSSYAIRNRLVKKKHYSAIFLTSRINMFLFFFNMIPIGFFDGAKVLSGVATYLKSIF